MQFDVMTALYSIITFLFGLLLSSFLPSYIQKKAENLATKEDISLITQKIEAIRSSIEINADAHKAYINDRKTYLVGFYDEITAFNYELMAVNFGDFPMDGGKSLFEYQKNFDKAASEILKAYQRLVIYLPPESKLLTVGNELTSNVLESRRILTKNFGSIKSTVAAEEEAYSLIPRNGKIHYKAAVASANEANKNYWAQMKPLAEELRVLYQTYLTELNLYLRKSELNA
tara:strand:+ start:711 stop:1400 length:690 start_codon:yes stop_codon:yes gene_type:complete